MPGDDLPSLLTGTSMIKLKTMLKRIIFCLFCYPLAAKSDIFGKIKGRFTIQIYSLGFFPFITKLSLQTDQFYKVVKNVACVDPSNISLFPSPPSQIFITYWFSMAIKPFIDLNPNRRSCVLKSSYSYPTVVIEMKAHQNPCKTP